ncbi:DUF3861 domain-containing protein [Hymenobacter coccineus]|uniref:DUF3861 domain-containing protein n=1 Tax=Hymenobacter coccineus TaxID=1908235 RepID=A0A1G1TGP3_9BACT|nr:DUF3861 domain-containing protein [Hymenobacter coccineus]OGX90042.1 hypothetical protein BEN49_07875 [Hymenobacter coccineus]
MAKRANRYRLTLEPLALASGAANLAEPMQLEFENHDEVFDIIRRLREKDPFQDAQQATEFAIGLKLFSEVMLRNRSHPLFAEFLPAFRAFMGKLKG